MTKELKEKLQKLVDHHENFKNSFFWNSPQSASCRRSYEKKNTELFEFDLDGNYYEINLKINCSCKNIYYQANFKINGNKKDVRIIKKLLK